MGERVSVVVQANEGAIRFVLFNKAMRLILFPALFLCFYLSLSLSLCLSFFLSLSLTPSLLLPLSLSLSCLSLLDIGNSIYAELNRVLRSEDRCVGDWMGGWVGR